MAWKISFIVMDNDCVQSVVTLIPQVGKWPKMEKLFQMKNSESCISEKSKFASTINIQN